MPCSAARPARRDRHAALGCGPLLARTRCDYGESLITGPRARPAHERGGVVREAYTAAGDFGTRGTAARAEQDARANRRSAVVVRQPWWVAQ
jgi:hypothetical protein